MTFAMVLVSGGHLFQSIVPYKSSVFSAEKCLPFLEGAATWYFADKLQTGFASGSIFPKDHGTTSIPPKHLPEMQIGLDPAEVKDKTRNNSECCWNRLLEN